MTEPTRREPVDEMDENADLSDSAADSAHQTRVDSLISLGRRIRDLRLERRLTLQDLADITGLSASMISLVERGRTSPSIGSVVVIAGALRVPLADLFAEVDQIGVGPVVRKSDQLVAEPWPGVSRRTAKADRLRHIEISMNEWKPDDGTNEPQPARHPGYEYGLVIEGELTVEVGEAVYVLHPGDLVSYPSTELHLLRNASSEVVRAVWFNLGSF